MAEAAAQGQFIHEEFGGARAQQSAGNLEEAKFAYGEILARVPHHTDSLVMLASIAYQQGDDIQAEAYVDRAIEIYKAVVAQMPNLLAARAPLVNLLLSRGRRPEAEDYAVNLDLPINPVRATMKEFARRRRFGKQQGLPAMLINTVPKSASESIWNKVAEGLSLGQGHLSLGLFPDCCVIPIRVRAACEGGFIAKEHICPTEFNLRALAEGSLTHMVCNLRDPRQATLSWAHFVKDDVSMRLMAPIWRKIVPPAALPKSDFGAYVDWCIENYLPLLIDFVQSWIEVEQNRDQPVKVLFLTFEDFLADPDNYFSRILDFYQVDPGRFARGAESETVHLRKGQTDEWRSVMSAKQRARAWELIPKEMAGRFGWVA